MFIFTFISTTLGHRLKKKQTHKFAALYFKECSTVFSSKHFVLSRLTFKSLIHFEFFFCFFCMMLENVLILFFYMLLSIFPVITDRSDCLFSIVYSCLMCCKLIDHKCIGLFLVFLPFSCFLALCVYFCASLILF